MGDNEFKHIAVTAADEDDFVIKAGIVDDSAPAAVPAETASAPRPAHEQAAVVEHVEKPASQESSIDKKPPVQTASEQVPTPANPPRGQTSSKKRDTYRETTLEDLESAPMPLAQRIVIIAAVVCIIGAVIYYFAFMG